LRVADVVVAPSEYVRRDILATYGSRWGRTVAAIPNPVSWRRFEGTEVGLKDLPGRRYVLSVSAQYAHKNLSTLLRAFAHLRGRTEGKGVTLVLAGQWSDRLIGIARRVDLREEVRGLGIEGAVRMTGYVSDAEIGALYRGASAFVFPSLYEGFGLPAVEALGFGLPVLTTRRTAIPETTLGLATYLDDPLDPVTMADALASMLAAPERFRPGPADVARIRETYAPARVGRLYLDALRGA
ncbi:MAG: glycosyltransferase family 1 protein, partial [Actinomycetota bacterium]